MSVHLYVSVLCVSALICLSTLNKVSSSIMLIMTSKHFFKLAVTVCCTHTMCLKLDLQYDIRPAYHQILIKSVGDLTF